MVNSRILVVDDDRSNCSILSKLLTAQGYSVDVADSGDAALKLVAKNPYGLALLDYRMPGMDGVELYRRIRELRPEMIAVFQTAYARIEVIYSAIEAGAERILAKPVDSQELLPLVERLLGKPSHAVEKQLPDLVAAYTKHSAEPNVQQSSRPAARPAARDAVDQQIRRQIAENVTHYAASGSAAIEQRLQELDREWDVERFLAANGAVASVVGLTLGLKRNPRWFLFPAVVGTFVLQHLFQGWCPALPLLRHWGIRTAAEIDQERYALKALRGDFQNLQAVNLPNSDLIQQALGAAER